MSGSTRFSLTRRILQVAGGGAAARKRRRGAHGLVEGLEDRQLLSASVASSREYRTTPVVQMPAATGGTTALSTPVALAPLSETFNLSSRPTATKTIYIDFDGHTTSGTPWNTTFTGGAAFTTPAFSLDGDTNNFSANELLQIQRMWQRVAEDFAPFDVNVTTKDPGVANLINSGGADTRWGIRVVVGGSNNQWLGLGAGGIAFLDSFGSATDIPCFAFSVTQGNDEQVIVETISHEAGHTLGLDHDGTGGLSYYGGHGSGTMSWGPIMGASFGISITQWSKGEYNGANNREDDLSIITTRNGFGYRPDDYGSSRFTASQLPGKKVGATRNVNAAGVIERNTDEDWFSFSTTGGAINLNFAGDSLGSNLDIEVTLYDPSGIEVMKVNPTNSLGANLSTVLTPGTYTIKIDGVGFGTVANGYSDYGSLGQYFITGTIPDTSTGTTSGGTSIIEGRVVNATNGGIGSVMMFIDLDGNGVFNAAVDKSASTNSQGNFKFTGLLGGTYLVYQVPKTGWSQVSTAPQSVFVAAASTTSNVIFRNVRPPALTSVGASTTYSTASGAAVLLTTTAVVSDPDSSSFGGGRLIVGLTGNGSSADIVAVRNQGNGLNQVGVFGSTLRYSGIVIGTVAGGIGGSDLVILFNANASIASVQAVLRNLTFRTTGSNPSKLTRTVSFLLSDGTGGTSAVVRKQIRVV